jgi:hypothetical protein
VLFTFLGDWDSSVFRTYCYSVLLVRLFSRLGLCMRLAFTHPSLFLVLVLQFWYFDSCIESICTYIVLCCTILVECVLRWCNSTLGFPFKPSLILLSLIGGNASAFGLLLRLFTMDVPWLALVVSTTQLGIVIYLNFWLYRGVSMGLLIVIGFILLFGGGGIISSVSDIMGCRLGLSIPMDFDWSFFYILASRIYIFLEFCFRCTRSSHLVFRSWLFQLIFNFSTRISRDVN